MDQGNLIPDPTLTRVVYPLALDVEGRQLALWDVENKKILAQINYAPFDQWSRSPFWSQDGSDFLIVGLSEERTIEWFQVTKDGLTRQLTHFGEFLNRANFNLPSRSSDGRYLAFQLPYNQNQQGTYDDSKYFFLDLKSQSLDGFCINYGDKSLPDKPIVWSPDSQYVVITHGTIGERSAAVILVDLEKQKAFQIATGIEAIGWMVKP
jgi:Tol biopolymer transport system component